MTDKQILAKRLELLQKNKQMKEIRDSKKSIELQDSTNTNTLFEDNENYDTSKEMKNSNYEVKVAKENNSLNDQNEFQSNDYLEKIKTFFKNFPKKYYNPFHDSSTGTRIGFYVLSCFTLFMLIFIISLALIKK